MTRAGKAVQITDKGEPLWILQPAAGPFDNPERAKAIDALLDDVLAAPESSLSLSKIVKDARRSEFSPRSHPAIRRSSAARLSSLAIA